MVLVLREATDQPNTNQEGQAFVAGEPRSVRWTSLGSPDLDEAVGWGPAGVLQFRAWSERSTGPLGGADRLDVVTFPWAAPTAAFAVLPAVRWAARLRKRRRLRDGCCAGCGYDLRATPDRGAALLDRCPECGSASANHAGATKPAEEATTEPAAAPAVP